MYATAEDVKRLLRVLDVEGNNQYKIRFSSSYDPIQAYSTNTGSGVLKSIIVAPSYAGSELWHIDFRTPIAFTLYRGESTNINDGTGNKSTAFISTSKIITIQTTGWSGTNTAVDKFKFRTSSNISDDDVTEFMDDADVIVDGFLSKFIGSTYVPFVEHDQIPKLISKASAFITANLIYSSVFANLSAEQMPAVAQRWYSFGKDLINVYLESIPGKEQYSFMRYARFWSRQPLFEKIGVVEAGGVEGLRGEIDGQNVEYDSDFNTRENLGRT